MNIFYLIYPVSFSETATILRILFNRFAKTVFQMVVHKAYCL